MFPYVYFLCLHSVMETRIYRILECANQLFKTQGFKQVTMDDIARELSMSKKTLYKYFRNKKDLISISVQAYIDKEKQEFCQIHDNANEAIGEMMSIIKHVVNMFETMNPNIFSELIVYYPESWEKMDGFLKNHIYEKIFKNIERGKQEGLYRKSLSSDIMAKMYVVKVKGIMEEDFFPTKSYKKKELLQALIEYHIRGIASKKGIDVLENYLDSNFK